MAATTNPPFMTGVPELLILRLLANREMYGYELVQAIERATGETIQLGEGVVYPMLHALAEKGCLRARRKAHNGRTRVYYTITPRGGRRLEAVSAEWARVSSAIARVLEGASYAAVEV
jgi:PadR family transcriptional regulator PadR